MGIWRRLKMLMGGEQPGTALRIVSNETRARSASVSAVMKKFSGWVYVCASRNAATVASVPLRLYVRGGASTEAKGWYGGQPVTGKHRAYLETKQKATLPDVTEITVHPALELLRLANPVAVGFELIETTVIHEELVGNAYWYLEPWTDPVRAGLPQHIWPLRPDLMTPVPNKNKNGLKGYLYGTNPATATAFTVDEIIHFKYPNPLDSLVGLGPAQAGIMAINRSTAMAEWKQALYDNHCRPDFMIVVPDQTSDDEIKNLYDQFDKRFRVRGNKWRKAGRPWITTADKDIKPLSFPPSQMGDIAQAKLDRDEVYQMFGVPVTTGEVAHSRAAAQTGEYVYMRSTVAPRLIRFEQTLNEFLAPLYDDRLFFAFDNPVPEDREALRQDVEMGVTKKLLTRNEGRQALGYDEHPDAEGFLESGGGGVPIGAEGGEPAKAAMFHHLSHGTAPWG